MNKIQILILLIFFACSNVLQAQTKDEIEAQRLIAASQTGGAPLIFKVNHLGVSLVDTGKTKYTNECIMRGGLPNFFYKAKKANSLRLGYIGGSITKGDGMYRNQSANYIQSMFPKAKMLGLNAGVSGTGSDLGACRLDEQILKHHPDLVFIEFAVNGAYPQGVEGIIRQIRQFDPQIDICLLYTMGIGQGATYASGAVPKQIQGLEKLAEHYQIPSIHMGLSIGILEKEGAVLWKGDPAVETTKIVFSKDGTHPLPTGGNLYAAAVARSFEKMKTLANDKLVTYTLTKPLYADNWEDGKMIAPLDIAVFSKGWKKIDPKSSIEMNSFSPWFPYIITADRAGENFTFRFKGDCFGIFDIGGPEVGQLLITIDGKAVNGIADTTKKIKSNRFNSFCNNRYRGQYVKFEVPYGEHTVKFEISATQPDKAAILGPTQQKDIQAHPEKYNQSVIYIGKILIKGVPLK